MPSRPRFRHAGGVLRGVLIGAVCFAFAGCQLGPGGLGGPLTGLSTVDSRKDSETRKAAREDKITTLPKAGPEGI